ncbi:hypothetical protein SK128_014880, partial [Halocaridina rubra]
NKCKRRWRTLRDAFIKARKRNGNGPKNKKWYLSEEMNFIIPFIEKKRCGNGIYLTPDALQSFPPVSQENDTKTFLTESSERLLLHKHHTTEFDPNDEFMHDVKDDISDQSLEYDDARSAEAAPELNSENIEDIKIEFPNETEFAGCQNIEHCNTNSVNEDKNIGKSSSTHMRSASTGIKSDELNGDSSRKRISVSKNFRCFLQSHSTKEGQDITQEDLGVQETLSGGQFLKAKGVFSSHCTDDEVKIQTPYSGRKFQSSRGINMDCNTQKGLGIKNTETSGKLLKPRGKSSGHSSEKDLDMQDNVTCSKFFSNKGILSSHNAEEDLNIQNPVLGSILKNKDNLIGKATQEDLDNKYKVTDAKVVKATEIFPRHNTEEGICIQDPMFGSDIQATRSIANDIMDPDTLFMLSQVQSLKKLSHRKNRYAKIKIQQLLYDLEFGNSVSN